MLNFARKCQSEAGTCYRLVRKAHTGLELFQLARKKPKKGRDFAQFVRKTQTEPGTCSICEKKTKQSWELAQFVRINQTEQGTCSIFEEKTNSAGNLLSLWGKKSTWSGNLARFVRKNLTSGGKLAQFPKKKPAWGGTNLWGKTNLRLPNLRGKTNRVQFAMKTQPKAGTCLICEENPTWDGNLLGFLKKTNLRRELAPMWIHDSGQVRRHAV